MFLRAFCSHCDTTTIKYIVATFSTPVGDLKSHHVALQLKDAPLNVVLKVVNVTARRQMLTKQFVVSGTEIAAFL